MNTDFVFQWPGMLPLPRMGQPVIVRVQQASRTKARTVLREVLSAWSGIALDALPIEETSRGPQWHGLPAGESLGISLSYCDGDAWIALIRGKEIGIDVAGVKSFSEIDAVARLYLGPDVATTIRKSATPEKTFAFAWTKLEACMKCMKRDLIEWNAIQAARFQNLSAREYLFENSTAVTVVNCDVSTVSTSP